MSLQIFGLTFNLYGLILGLAILASLQASLWLAKERQLETKAVENLFWWVIIGGITGARLYHVIDKWGEIYSASPVSTLYIWNGGLAIWGAVIGGVAGLAVGAKLAQTKIVWRELLDLTFFGLPLGQAIGRWGNFANGEIVGKNGEPLFFFESIANLALFFVLWRGQKKWRGRLMGIYLVGYGSIRLFLESFRQSGDQWLVGGISMATIFALAAIGLGLVSFRVLFDSSQRSGKAFGHDSGRIAGSIPAKRQGKRRRQGHGQG